MLKSLNDLALCSDDNDNDNEDDNDNDLSDISGHTVHLCPRSIIWAGRQMILLGLQINNMPFRSHVTVLSTYLFMPAVKQTRNVIPVNVLKLWLSLNLKFYLYNDHIKSKFI